MKEKTFFEYEDVKVTNARFIIGAQTFAMSSITSIKTVTDKPSKFWGIVILVIGLLTVALGLHKTAIGVVTVGGLLVVASTFHLYRQKTAYHVILNTSGGKTKAFTTYQSNYLTKVVGALNEAIVHRG